MRANVSHSLLQLARSLPVPYLGAITFATFVADLLVPDLIPFADELLLALLTLLFGALGHSRTDELVPIPVTQTRA
jgi:hypothetical protein